MRTKLRAGTDSIIIKVIFKYCTAFLSPFIKIKQTSSYDDIICVPCTVIYIYLFFYLDDVSSLQIIFPSLRLVLFAPCRLIEQFNGIESKYSLTLPCSTRNR